MSDSPLKAFLKSPAPRFHSKDCEGAAPGTASNVVYVLHDDKENGVTLVTTEPDPAKRVESTDCFTVPRSDLHSPYTIAESILEAIAESETLMACESFSELHDHCDANCLGCTEEVLDFGPFWEAIEVINEAQGIVDQHLAGRKGGGA